MRDVANSCSIFALRCSACAELASKECVRRNALDSARAVIPCWDFASSSSIHFTLAKGFRAATDVDGR